MMHKHAMSESKGVTLVSLYMERRAIGYRASALHVRLSCCNSLNQLMLYTHMQGWL